MTNAQCLPHLSYLYVIKKQCKNIINYLLNKTILVQSLGTIKKRLIKNNKNNQTTIYNVIKLYIYIQYIK